MHGEPQPTDAVEIAAAWTRCLFQGRVQQLDWLSTRSLTVDLRGDKSRQTPLSREGTLVLSRVLQAAFPRAAWNVNRVEQREHQILADAELSVRHEGILDLSPFDGPVLEATGARARLPRQRVEWDILHGRVHQVRIVQGPGLGLDVIARELGAHEETSLEGEPVLPACRELDSVAKELVEPLRGMAPYPVREGDHAPVATRPNGNGSKNGNGSNGNGSEKRSKNGNGTHAASSNGSTNGTPATEDATRGPSSLRDRIDEMLDGDA